MASPKRNPQRATRQAAQNLKRGRPGGPMLPGKPRKPGGPLLPAKPRRPSGPLLPAKPRTRKYK